MNKLKSIFIVTIKSSFRLICLVLQYIIKINRKYKNEDSGFKSCCISVVTKGQAETYHIHIITWQMQKKNKTYIA